MTTLTNRTQYNKYIKIFKGNTFINQTKKVPSHSNQNQKAITFDLDETLGSFEDLYILWCCIIENTNYIMNQNEQKMFNDLLDIYPEFLRYGILNILDYLYHKKLSGKCSKIFLYTNNQCFGKDNLKWLNYIVSYFDEKINTEKREQPLFDQIIGAFKIGNQILEKCRTTQNKTYGDLIKCTILPKTTEICFLDNTYYNKMLNDRVYYIQPKSYNHSLSVDEIIKRFLEHTVKWGVLHHNFQHILLSYFSEKKRSFISSSSNPNIDVIVSQKIMYHLKEFFLLSCKQNHKTKKISLRIGHFTRKMRTKPV